jgi:hypothetical protein
MSDDVRLSLSFQESVITAIAYASNGDAAPILAVITPDVFEGIFADIASRIIEYRERYKEPPAPAHLDDIFDHILDDPEHKQFRAYNRILIGMREQAPSINIPYLTSRIVQFVRRQKLKEGFLEALERFNKGGEDFEDDVETILTKTLKTRVESTSLGIRLSNDPLDFLNKDDVKDGLTFRTGIDEFDRKGFTPYRGQVYLLFAGYKKGKSWMLQQFARAAIEGSHWNVAHASLENRLGQLKPRYMQTWLSAAKREERYIHAEMDIHDFKLKDIMYDVVTPKWSFSNPKHHKHLKETAERLKPRFNKLYLQEFNSGSLTAPQLERWLDMIEDREGFIPDMLLVDYPKLMKLDMRDPRISMGQIWVDLRRIAGERNLAIVAVDQGNREGQNAKVLRGTHASEDISPNRTADAVMTYSQTEAEKRMGLARLFAEGSRNDVDGFSVLISQAYTIGQFALESVRMSAAYWEILEEVDKQAIKENLSSEEDE